jgi:hypothetical protein
MTRRSRITGGQSDFVRRGGSRDDPQLRSGRASAFGRHKAGNGPLDKNDSPDRNHVRADIFLQPLVSSECVNQFTIARYCMVYQLLQPPPRSREMLDKPDFLTITIAVCVAGYFAGAFGFIAYHDLGFSADHIRDAAIASATVIASLLAIDHFGKKYRRDRGDRIDG